jgi:hypothetical protein
MRKLWFPVLILALIALTAASAVIYGQEDDPDEGETVIEDGLITGIVSVDGSTVYVGPDFAYRIIGRLNINTSVVVLGRRGDFFTRWDGNQWLEIQYGSRRAWVYARLIRTSVPFNSIPPTGIRLPRNENGRVPEIFDLSSNICDSWVGGFTQSGSFMAGDSQIIVTYPTMPGAIVYSVIVISPTGFRTAFDSDTTTATIEREFLPAEPGIYTWRVAPYWTNGTERWRWQQICLLRTGGTFELPPRAPDPTPEATPQS